MDDLLRTDLESFGCKISPCGSRVTCNPPPAGTDQDYLVEVPHGEKNVRDAMDAFGSAGFHWEGSEHYQNAMADGFMSWRKDDVNLIVTSNAGFAARHRAATALCTRLNLMEKADRIALFQAVLYGAIWDEEDPSPAHAPAPAPVPVADFGDDLPY